MVIKYLAKVRGKLANLLLLICQELTRTKDKSWLYYCPRCRNSFEDRKPEKPLALVLTCPRCFFRCLVGGSLGKPYVLNPDILQRGIKLCRYGCHYENSGFESLTDCPVHR